LSYHKDFKYGVRVDHSKSQPTDNELSLKGVWSHDPLLPLKYLKRLKLETANYIHWLAM